MLFDEEPERVSSCTPSCWQEKWIQRGLHKGCAAFLGESEAYFLTPICLGPQLASSNWSPLTYLISPRAMHLDPSKGDQKIGHRDLTSYSCPLCCGSSKLKPHVWPSPVTTARCSCPRLPGKPISSGSASFITQPETLGNFWIFSPMLLCTTWKWQEMGGAASVPLT